ncbi:MAG: PEP-CTERM sorting domain-containing protein [Fimbriimonadales bacterium]|nr:PEP-CTERM sorting domain-containing protein [Fimbriimonadales bacterium]
MASFRKVWLVLGFLASVPASFGWGLTGDPVADGWSLVGDSLDTDFLADQNNGPLSFTAYSVMGSWSQFSFNSTGAIGDLGGKAGWSASDLVLGLGFVASYDGEVGSFVRSAYFKFDFLGIGPWQPVRGGDPEDGDRSRSKFTPVPFGSTSFIRGGFQGYIHQQNGFIGLAQNHSDQSFNVLSLGNSSKPYVLALARGAQTDPFHPQWKLVERGQFLLNYTLLKASVPSVSNYNPLLKMVMGVYGPNYGQDISLFGSDSGQDIVWQYQENIGPQSVPVPEPATMALAGLGLAMAVRRRRR